MRYINPRFTYLLTYLLAHPGSPGQSAVKRVCVCIAYTLQGKDHTSQYSDTVIPDC